MHQPKEINRWEDIEVFKGKIVAFDTNIYYYRGTEKMITQYAMVGLSPSSWQFGGTGYNMSIFKKKTETAGNRALINEFLRSGIMTMRTPDETELKQLISKLQTDQYGFEYYDNKYTLPKVESQLPCGD